MANFLDTLGKKKLPPLPLAQSVMMFREFYLRVDDLKEDVYCFGEDAGIVACQTVPSLEIWILENWGTKKDTFIPNEIQKLYDEAVTDLKQKLQLA